MRALQSSFQKWQHLLVQTKSKLIFAVAQKEDHRGPLFSFPKVYLFNRN